MDLRGKLPTNGRYGVRSLAGLVGFTLHYSAGPASQTPRQIAAFHTGPERGWPGIAYTYLVDGAGTPNLCNDLSAASYHSAALGRNAAWVGICYTGDREPSLAQRRGIAAAMLDAETRLGRRLERLEGHGDVMSTSCPGPAWPSWKPAVLRLSGR